ncbi:MAG: aminopeptidase P family protein [Alphaproteobacteria bacterium]|nr:aminopeptidase P family protein [Alphaproteobacteria bacterium]
MKARLDKLRAELARQGLDGFIVPHADEFQNEYLPPSAERLAWITGFTGSAGAAVILKDNAAAFTDGRYTIQIREQVDAGLFDIRHISDEPPKDWVAEHLGRGGRLGYDPWLHTERGLDVWRKAAEKAGGEIVAVEHNPLDAAWTDRPAAPAAPVRPHDEAFAGESSAAKRQRVAKSLADAGADSAVVTAPDSIAWLLNIRGGDVAHSPLPLSFAILYATGRAEWFVDPAKIGPDLAAHLGGDVTIRDATEFEGALWALGNNRVLADPSGTAALVFERLGKAGAQIVRADDPCQLPKACKNQVEIEGMRKAHRRDGVALSRFLAWLAAEAPKGGVGEIAAADRLEALRFEGEHITDLSFRTISGSGPNGAIVHYSVTPESDRMLGLGELYLVDSGGQYRDGTTDVTRTVAIGDPTAEMRDRFTRVLKGHIALATVRFPEGTSGSQLDILARHALWQAGLDYDHGTGHGVGSYLGVHEGPQRISKIPNSVALKPGMIISNEPGYYKTGAYGIRIENLVCVTALEIEGAEKPMLGFETLTLAPIDLDLVDPSLLTQAETEWLNAYHGRVREALISQVDDKTAAWLESATRPLNR